MSINLAHSTAGIAKLGALHMSLCDKKQDQFHGDTWPMCGSEQFFFYWGNYTDTGSDACGINVYTMYSMRGITIPNSREWLGILFGLLTQVISSHSILPAVALTTNRCWVQSVESGINRENSNLWTVFTIIYCKKMIQKQPRIQSNGMKYVDS